MYGPPGLVIQSPMPGPERRTVARPYQELNLPADGDKKCIVTRILLTF